MIGIDTNILLRFFLEDDTDQSARAKALLATLSSKLPGYIPSVILAESVWVLESNYRKPKHEVILFVEGLLGSEQLILEHHEAVEQALSRFKDSNSGFTDCLIERLCNLASCTQTMTFDVNASKSSGMVLL